jgi:four helix bundle protein
MSKTSNKKYDLEERTFHFIRNVIRYVDSQPKRTTMIEIGRQLVRSAGSVGANYIEANESLNKKDFIMRIKISKKEAKETYYWLKLTIPTKNYEHTKTELMCESEELQKIFGAIIRNSTI